MTDSICKHSKWLIPNQTYTQSSQSITLGFEKYINAVQLTQDQNVHCTILIEYTTILDFDVTAKYAKSQADRL